LRAPEGRRLDPLSKVKKAVLSVDNGISHLTHFIGVPHLLLYPQCLPDQWVNNPNKNAVSVKDEPVNFHGDRIIKLIEDNFLK
jgi:ADP-heptose:LPS heptosyltransferase